MNDTPTSSASNTPTLRLVSTWSGMAAMAAIAMYLMLASAVPHWLAGALGVSLFAPEDSVQKELFWYPPFLAMIAVFYAAMIVATVVAVPLRLRNAGAWCSHVGLIALGAGAVWYAGFSQSGDSLTFRTHQGWTPVNYVYLDRSFAVYVHDASDANGRPLQHPLDGLIPRGEPQDLDATVTGTPEGVTIRATQFLPRAGIVRRWANISPNIIPAVELSITDGDAAETVVLSPSLPGHEHVGARDYLVTYRPAITPEGLEKIVTPTDANEAPGVKYDLALVLTGGQIEPTLVVIHPDGSRWHAKLQVGKAIDAPLAGRSVRIEPVAFFDHAAEVHEFAEPHDHLAPQAHGLMADEIPAGPAVKLEIRSGHWRRETLVPFAAYENFAEPQMIDLPGNRAVWLNFSRERVKLPATIEVKSARYETYPASGIPKDYVCKVAITAGAKTTAETLCLNNPVTVGGFQFSQGSWAPAGATEPTRIFFGAASRPGLPIIWLGCTLICLGFPYAFYVKPLLMRRRAGK